MPGYWNRRLNHMKRQLGPVLPATSKKRHRQNAVLEIGAPSEDDLALLAAPQSIPSSTGWSTRPQTLDVVPSLGTTAINVFAQHLVLVYERNQEFTRQLMKLVPDALLLRLWTALRREQPTVLSHGFIVAVCTE